MILNSYKMNRYAIIVAGGKGTRFGSDVPKQFLPLNGIPVLMHTINRFADGKAEIIVVLPAAQIEDWQELCKKHDFTTPHKVVTGGNTRFGSVKNALDTITPQKGDLIAVHDGVRPLVSKEIIDEAFTVAAESGSAIPAIDVTDTIRRLDDDGVSSKALLRSSLRAVQTPQTFDAEILKSAYDVPFSESFTDDASVVESAGHQVTLTKGSPRNIKITHSIDLLIAEELLKNE